MTNLDVREDEASHGWQEVLYLQGSPSLYKLEWNIDVLPEKVVVSNNYVTTQAFEISISRLRWEIVDFSFLWLQRKKHGLRLFQATLYPFLGMFVYQVKKFGDVFFLVKPI